MRKDNLQKEYIIQTEKLTKSYNQNRVVNGLNLKIRKYEIFGLLGPNAAGKSTTIRMLADIIQPDSGSVKIDGFDLSKHNMKIKNQIGYVSQHFGLYDQLSVIENIRFYASLYDVVNEIFFKSLLDKYGLNSYYNTKAGELSGGYKRRLSLVCALAHDPKILFLDEPTAGIDPVTRKEIWDIFYTLINEKKTLFVTTHYMEEAERCNEIAFLNHGKIIAKGTPQLIKDSLIDYDVYSFVSSFKHEMIKFLNAQNDIILLNQFGNEIRIIVRKNLQEEELKLLMLPYVVDKPILKKTNANLEDVFIAVSQNKKYE